MSKKKGPVGVTLFCARCGDDKRPMKFVGTDSQGYVFECVKPIRFRGKIRRYDGCGYRQTVAKERVIEVPQRTPAPVDDRIPFGVVPSIDDVAKPLGVTAGYHTHPGPHHPWHDDRRIYK